MEHLRGELHHEYGAIVRGARVLADWQYYVRTFPWACVGAAAALGFLAVPRRLEVMSPDAETLAKLAKHNRLVVKQQPEAQAKSGLVGSLLTLAANAALRAVIAYTGSPRARSRATAGSARRMSRFAARKRPKWPAAGRAHWRT
jgi:hypothetical protein